jgi:hypothetical protein
MLAGDLRGGQRILVSLAGEIAYGAISFAGRHSPRRQHRRVACHATSLTSQDLRHDVRIWLSLAETGVWRLDCKTLFSLDIQCRRIRERISGRQSRWATHSSNPVGKTRRQYGSERRSQPTPVMSTLHAGSSLFSWINDCWRKRLRHWKDACGATRLISVFWLNKSESGSLSMTKNCGKTRSRGFGKLWNWSHGM